MRRTVVCIAVLVTACQSARPASSASPASRASPTLLDVNATMVHIVDGDT
ncbi:MAG: hypothetical protein QOE00_1547, partial [Ilumatobacteraceae bacterium]